MRAAVWIPDSPQLHQVSSQSSSIQIKRLMLHSDDGDVSKHLVFCHLALLLLLPPLPPIFHPDPPTPTLNRAMRSLFLSLSLSLSLAGRRLARHRSQLLDSLDPSAGCPMQNTHTQTRKRNVTQKLPDCGTAPSPSVETAISEYQKPPGKKPERAP